MVIDTNCASHGIHSEDFREFSSNDLDFVLVEVLVLLLDLARHELGLHSEEQLSHASREVQLHLTPMDVDAP